jgi:hypothetical protein
VKLRVRTRGRWGSNAVTVGGKAWPAANATEQTIFFAEAPEVGAAQKIVVLTPAPGIGRRAQGTLTENSGTEDAPSGHGPHISSTKRS